MDRRRSLAASEDEVRRLRHQSLSEVTPSRRDFSLYIATQKQELAIVARVAATQVSGHHWSTAELVAYARACDEAEVAALAVATGADGLSLEDMAAIAAATTAPVLRDDLLIDPVQLYHARLHGADAGVLPLAELDDDAIDALITVAQSLHMAIVVELLGDAEMDRAVRLPHVILGLRCTDRSGGLDVLRTRQLAQQLPRHRTSMTLSEIRSPDDYAALNGVCDAVLVGEVLIGSDVGEVLRTITGH